MDQGFDGSTGAIESGPLAGFSNEEAVEEPVNQFAELGPILEDEDKDVFKDTNDLILRQELLATNRWNQDEYYKCVVDGYPWATLEHDTDRDVYTFSLPPYVSTVSIQPVPNKNLDLVNKTSEQMLVDFPEADAEPMDDSEEAEQAAEMADRFLKQECGEQGTNAAVLYDDRVKLALVTATTYIERWVDPSGNGYVPLQIEAHPQAVSPDNPLVGPDGMPTTDLVLRYVTAPKGGQFTDDPSQAAPQWQPKIRDSKWERQHIRTYPENLPVDKASEVIVLGYCTLGEAKRRWPSVEKMAPEDLSSLCDWQPPRYLVLLPPFQRTRWKTDPAGAKQKNKAGASDERIMFYYHRYVKARPEYPKGADVVMSGVDDGLIIDKKLLSVEVEVAKGQTEKVKETRCREIPVIQITPRGDPYGQDPTGKCYLSLFVGATESNAMMTQSYAEALRKSLKMPYASSSLSPISGEDVKAAMASGDILPVIRPEDLPEQLAAPKLDPGFFHIYEMSDEAINSIASAERAAQGAENSKERSGKALQIAVSQNNIGKTSMLTAVNNAFARDCRIMIEIAMAEYTTAQQIAYVGEDGANKMMDLHAMDFALIGKVGIKAGTGTGLSQDGKVQYLGNLKAEQFISPEEATDAARPSFAKRLGLAPNPFEQYVSRCIDSWLDGPPETPAPDPSQPPQIDPATGQPVPPPDWKTQYRAWMQAQDIFDQQQAQYTQAVQRRQQQAQAAMQPAPEGENAAPRVPAPTGPEPIAPPPNMVPKPWVPFEPRPNDTEPQLSKIWASKLSRVMSSNDYRKFGPEWTDVLDRQYTLTRQAAAIGAGAQAQQPAPKSGGSQPTPPTQPSQPTQPTQSPPPMAAGAR